MVKNSILELMVKDHKKMIESLDEVEKDNYPNFEAFCRFKWHLEKHIFIEEKAIFIYYHKRNDDDIKKFEKLSNEHTVILDLLDKILKDSFPKGNINFNKLKHLLSNHKKFEEKNIYPQLDKEISDFEKSKIIKKIKDIIKTV
jgi:hypothetical protein